MILASFSLFLNFFIFLFFFAILDHFMLFCYYYFKKIFYLIFFFMKIIFIFSSSVFQVLSTPVDKTQNTEPSGTFRNIPKHEKDKNIFYEKNY